MRAPPPPREPPPRPCAPAGACPAPMLLPWAIAAPPWFGAGTHAPPVRPIGGTSPLIPPPRPKRAPPGTKERGSTWAARPGAMGAALRGAAGAEKRLDQRSPCAPVADCGMERLDQRLPCAPVADCGMDWLVVDLDGPRMGTATTGSPAAVTTAATRASSRPLGARPAAPTSSIPGRRSYAGTGSTRTATATWTRTTSPTPAARAYA